MKLKKEVILKNGKKLIIRNAKKEDAKGVLEVFTQTHAESDHLLTYPEESTFTVEQKAQFLTRKEESNHEIELIGIIDGKIIGNVGVDAIGNKYKIKHRAEFGISILKEYLGLGIEKIMTEIAIACAKKKQAISN